MEPVAKKPRGGNKLTYAQIMALVGRLIPMKPWPADKVVRRDPSTYQEPSRVMIRRCNRPHCGHWTSTERVLCVVCYQTPL